MLSLNIQFETSRSVTNNETVDLYWNVDERGIASDGIDTDTPLNATPIRLFPGAGQGESWGESPWGEGAWGGEDAIPAVNYDTPEVCFGRVKIAGKAMDAVGNPQAGAIIETEIVVNSNPTPPARLERSSFAAGRQAFTFMQSPQVQAA